MPNNRTPSKRRRRECAQSLNGVGRIDASGRLEGAGFAMLRLTGAAFIARVMASIEAVMGRPTVESIFSRRSVIAFEKPAEPR
jgi:hypothetical protein